MKNLTAFVVFAFLLSVFNALWAEEKVRIALQIEGESPIFVELWDNPAARDFVALLPLKLNFRDYVGEEKISPKLAHALFSQGFDDYDPDVGDFFYFAPWGNLGFFYNHKPAPYKGLVPLGKLNPQDLEKIKKQTTDFAILFERGI